MTNKKKILVLSAGYYYSQVLKQLADDGFHVASVDRDPNAPGRKFSHVFAPIDIIDKTAVLEFAKTINIDGVMPVNDFGTRTAAFLCENLDLPGYGITVASAANDKGLQRDIWRKASLPQPEYRVIHTLDELYKSVQKLGFPCVLKPTDCGGGGRGISVIRDQSEILWSYNFAKPYVKNSRFIVEEFIDGIEMTVETISNHGNICILAMSDKVKPDLRTRVATSLNYPAFFDEKVSEAVKELVKKAVRAIGIHLGMAHTEVIVTKNGPRLVEIGARGGGGHVFHTCIEATSGVRAPVMAARLLTGQSCDIGKIKTLGCVYRFFNPPVGILKEVKNINKAAMLQGVLDIGIIKKKGDKVGALDNSLQRAGYVVTKGQNREEAITLADQVESMIEFDVEENVNTTNKVG